MLQSLQNQEILNGYNFSRIADVIFAINVPNEDLLQFNIKNYKVISKNELFTGFKLKKLNLKNGDVIFCNSSYTDLLFKYLKKFKEVTNLTLITTQSDTAITKKIFLNRPQNIKKWYAVNVDYKNSNLIPIPLGLANNYSPKNIRFKDLEDFKFKQEEKINKLYINLRSNTNIKERANLNKIFENKEWVVIKEPNLSIDQYINDLQKYKFILCPWGNGVDTHRIWETLYCGSIPVTKKHIGLSFESLPIISVNCFNDITIERLIEISESQKSNYEALNISFWEGKIKSNNIISNLNVESLNEIKYLEYIFWKKIKFNSFVESKFKIIKFYLRKFTKKLYKLFQNSFFVR